MTHYLPAKPLWVSQKKLCCVAGGKGEASFVYPVLTEAGMSQTTLSQWKGHFSSAGFQGTRAGSGLQQTLDTR